MCLAQQICNYVCLYFISKLYLISCVVNCVYKKKNIFYFTDGRMGLSILPIAALLTGTLFTVGIAVLFVVVVAVRKRRCQGGRNMCDDKDKHLGMLKVVQMVVGLYIFYVINILTKFIL